MQIAVCAMESGALSHASTQRICSFGVIVPQKARLKFWLGQEFPYRRCGKRQFDFTFDPRFLRIDKLPGLLPLRFPHTTKVIHAQGHLAQVLVCLGMEENLFTIFQQS